MSPFDKLSKLLQNNKELLQNEVIEVSNPVSLKPEKISYNEWGFRQAGRLDGSSNGLLAMLAIVSDDFIHNATNHQSDRNENIKKAETIKNQLLDKKESIVTKSTKAESEINDFKTKISNLRREISEIKKNPQSVLPDKISKVSFIIGLLILVALTIYLFIFYSSASYSAFFKEFTLNQLGIANSIFDPKALSNALKDGTTELILIISMPFVFIGLGFLIHKFQEQKGVSKFFKIAVLMLVTFIFDTILAYGITSKIYNILASNSFKDMPPYTLQMAFEDKEFWLIIFAGFIVYVIWGFVFDFTMETYDKLDIVKQIINAHEIEITEYEKEIKNLNDAVLSNNNEVSVINFKIHDADEIINGSKIPIDTDKFKKMVGEFLGGWLKFLVGANFKESEIKEAKDKTDEFVFAYLNNYKSKSILA
jgi:peptidoglycan hydrolase CwlO-like protein